MAKLLVSRTVKLDGNGNAVDHIGGAVVIVSTLSIGPSVDITWLDGGGNESGTAAGILSGQKAHAGGDFAGLKLKGQPNDVCSLYIGPADASLDSVNALNAVIGHVIVDNEVEVKNDAGNPLVVNVPGAQLMSDAADAQAAAGAASLQGIVARLQAWNGLTFDRLKIGAVAGSILSDIADRAGRLLGVTDVSDRAARVVGVVTIGATEKIADNADAQAAAGAAALQGVVSRLMAWNGATFDRLKIGATAGSLLSDVADRAGRLVGIVYGSLGQLAQVAIGAINALRVSDQGFAFANAYFSTAGMVANTAETVLAPGSNVNGVDVWDAEFLLANDASAAYSAVLIYKASAPAGTTDGTVILAPDKITWTTGAGGLGAVGAKLGRSRFVPAGQGIYFIASANLNSFASKKVLYTNR